MRNYKKLLNDFLELSVQKGLNINPLSIVRSNSYQIGQANVLVRTASDLGKRYFFGLNYINAEEIYNLDNSFFAFVCGNAEFVIFIPSETLIKLLPEISHDRNGEYKINFTRDFELVLSGKENRFDCSNFLNNWNLLQSKNIQNSKLGSAEKKIHSVIQGRLIEIGNIRGYSTFCPDKSKKFNKQKLQDLITLKKCPELQFSDYNSLRNIDVIWFRKINKGFYPDYAFEVEITTGVWSGFGRLAALTDYSTKMYIVTNENRRFDQVSNSFPNLRNRYLRINPDNVGLLYSAEKSLIQLRKDFNL
ncbi:MAG: hypothetical protein GDA51_09365 [Ekhidna sp.]|nr:hypothetical protein [Ekhidna sp.]